MRKISGLQQYLGSPMKCLLEPPETQLEGVPRKLTRNFHNFMTKISSEEKLNFNLHIYNNIYKSIFYIADIN